MTKYTAAQEQELRDIGRFDLNAAKAFADKHRISVRSVIPKIKSLGLEYVTKDAVKKTPSKALSGSRERVKEDIVKSVRTILQLDLKSLTSMTNADLLDLEAQLLKVARGG